MKTYIIEEHIEGSFIGVITDVDFSDFTSFLETIGDMILDHTQDESCIVYPPPFALTAAWMRKQTSIQLEYKITEHDGSTYESEITLSSTQLYHQKQPTLQTK